jgi:adenylyltransferase/sulfurtransferase
MAVKIMIPTPLRAYVEKKDSVALAALTSQFAELRRHLYADDGRLRSFVNVYLNDEDIRYLQKDKTQVNDGDTISIVPSIAGGATR